MLRTTTAGFLLALLAACSSSDPDGAAATRGEAAGAAANADAVAAAVESNPDKTRLQAACDARFTAMLARRTRCPGYSATKLPEQENERPNFVTDCVARGSRPSSGLDAAFNVSCTAALADLGCDAGPALAVACGTKKGAMARGTRCAADDQCESGCCALPEGAMPESSCGTCDDAVWVKENGDCTAENARCGEGLSCAASGAYPGGGPEKRFCSPATPGYGLAKGAACKASGSGGEPVSTASQIDACPHTARAPGETCDSTTSCTAGNCIDDVCVAKAKLGEHCETAYEKGPRCAAWLECGGGRACQLPEVLACR